MGSAYFIVLEHKIDGIDTGMDGKSLAQHIEFLDEVARGLRVRPLSKFFSPDPEHLADFLDGEGADVGDTTPNAPQHFPAQDGLVTIRALASHPEARADGVAMDLAECERILSAAAQHRVNWRFEIDF